MTRERRRFRHFLEAIGIRLQAVCALCQTQHIGGRDNIELNVALKNAVSLSYGEWSLPAAGVSVGM
jgi:hypothetical protein